jgi:hypothetical protein
VIVQFLFATSIIPVPVLAARKRRRTTQLALGDVGSISAEAGIVRQFAPWNRVVLRAHAEESTKRHHSISDMAADLFKEADAFASIREMLLQYGPQLPNSQVLPDSYQSNFAGIAVPKGNMPRLSYISDMLDGMKRDGSLQRIIHDTGLRGIEVVTHQ